MGPFGIAVLVVYVSGMVCVGSCAGLKRRQEDVAYSFFFATHSLTWPSIGMALFARNISCVHLVNLAQAGYGQRRKRWSTLHEFFELASGKPYSDIATIEFSS